MIKKQLKRHNPRNYRGSRLTAHKLSDLLPEALGKIGKLFEEKGELVIMLWPEIVGPQLARMTQAVAFNDSVLHVKVKNSTLYSVLVQDRIQIIKKMRAHLPHNTLRHISFRMV